MAIDRRSGRARSRFAGVMGIILLFAVLAPPVVNAAIQRVRVANRVAVEGRVRVTNNQVVVRTGDEALNIADSTGDSVEAQGVGTMGEFDAPGSAGALAVRNFAGGGGVLGAGDCTASTGRPNVILLDGVIVTAVMVTGTNGRVTLASNQTTVDPTVFDSILALRVDSVSHNESMEFGNGMTIPGALRLTGSASGGSGDGDCQYVVLGQSET